MWLVGSNSISIRISITFMCVIIIISSSSSNNIIIIIIITTGDDGARPALRPRGP